MRIPSRILRWGGLIILLAACSLEAAAKDTATAAKVSKEEVTKLVEPIALYPDPLLQQILPAATFPDQIADAALLIRTKSDAELIKEQEWDNSVKYIATYAGVLKMMYEKLDWTKDLGEAFLAQHEDVLSSIQDLRAKAKAVGNLNTSSEQNVKTTKASDGNTYITIEPSNPEVVYVPQQASTTVYTEKVDYSSVLVPMATFGLGLALGSAMNDDDDNYYYGGAWGGPMWGGGYYNDSWADTRRARNEDIHDRVMDRQDFRQGQRSDRQDYRQDHPEQFNKESRNAAKQNFQNNKDARAQNFQNNKANRSQNLQGSSDRQAQLNSARASMESRGFSGSGTARSGSGSVNRSGSSGWSGQGGSSYASRASSRGASSRSYSGGGGSFRGGGGGGFSRGGGGGGRRR